MRMALLTGPPPGNVDHDNPEDATLSHNNSGIPTMTALLTGTPPENVENKEQQNGNTVEDEHVTNDNNNEDTLVANDNDNEAVHATVNWDDLPDSTFTDTIMAFLGPRDVVLHLGLACKRLRRLSSSNNRLWQTFCSWRGIGHSRLYRHMMGIPKYQLKDMAHWQALQQRFLRFDRASRRPNAYEAYRQLHRQPWPEKTTLDCSDPDLFVPCDVDNDPIVASCYAPKCISAFCQMHHPAIVGGAGSSAAAVALAMQQQQQYHHPHQQLQQQPSGPVLLRCDWCKFQVCDAQMDHGHFLMTWCNVCHFAACLDCRFFLLGRSRMTTTTRYCTGGGGGDDHHHHYPQCSQRVCSQCAWCHCTDGVRIFFKQVTSPQEFEHQDIFCRDCVERTLEERRSHYYYYGGAFPNQEEYSTDDSEEEDGSDDGSGSFESADDMDTAESAMV